MARHGIMGNMPAELVAEVAEVRKVAGVFGVRAMQRSIRELAERALVEGDPEAQAVAEELLREMAKIRP